MGEISLSPAKRGNNGNHGAKGRSGRRPKPITLARRALVQNKIESAEAAFALQEQIMYDEEQSLVSRQAAACWIYENVMGKPLQMTRNAEQAEYERAVDWRAGKSPEQIADLERMAAAYNADAGAAVEAAMSIVNAKSEGAGGEPGSREGAGE